MSVFGIQAIPEISLEEYERRLRATNSQHASPEDFSVELVRFVDSLALPRTRSYSPLPTVSMLGPRNAEAPQPLEMTIVQALVDVAPEKSTGTASDIEAPRGSKFDDAFLPRGWTLKVSALALAAGAALIGVAFGLKGAAPGQSKAPPFVVSAEDLTKAPQGSGKTVATLSDAGVIALKHIHPTAVKVVTSEEQPIELGARASPGNAPPSANLASADAAQPTTGASSGPLAEATANTPAIAAPSAAPQPAAPQFPDSKALRTDSPGPRGTRIATSTPSVTDKAVHASDRSQLPDNNAPKGASEAAGLMQQSTHKLVSPRRLSGKPSARIVVAKTETAPPGPIELGDRSPLGNTPASPNSAPTSAAEQPTAGASSGPPVEATVNTPAVAAPLAAPRLAAPQFPASAGVGVAKTGTGSPGTQADKPTETPPTEQPVYPLSHAFSYIVGALRPATSAQQLGHQPDAHKSGDWAIQFAAQKSEAEAKVKVARLNAKYAAALNGARIGVDKALVNGETVFALRVSGLSKADAAALCDRLKGRDCFLVK